MNQQLHLARHLRHAMTQAESLLWRHLRAQRFAGEKFRRQQPIGAYIVDFVHFGARLIIEADGSQHQDCAHDQTRDRWLCAQGYLLLRFWNHDILLHTNQVLDEIHRAVIGRGR
ncbi:endonuclease domain-containing protein [Pseudomarimonas arenosa]|uniref:DUF559 domain-containing protein n=1 Tax=Pseudomarimonas arenosa TaxID=2774145 RepID=A0AAW3ZLJ1_9GAMM|nr:DUF559 domain-containing protein [Pseudomarimonas arenosa]MBD8526906.1 DUF559 domain-containing protein [Pseudomarimonas arenosa]